MELLAQHLTSLVHENKEASVRYSQFYGFERKVEHLFHQESSATGLLSVCLTLSNVGALVRAFAPLLCDLGLIPRLRVIRGLSLLLVLCYERLYTLYHSFPLSSKTKTQHY